MLPGIRAWVVLDVALEPAAGLVEQVRGHRYVDLRRCHAAVAEVGRKRRQESGERRLFRDTTRSSGGWQRNGCSECRQDARHPGFLLSIPAARSVAWIGVTYDGLFQRRPVAGREERGCRSLAEGALLSGGRRIGEARRQGQHPPAPSGSCRTSNRSFGEHRGVQVHVRHGQSPRFPGSAALHRRVGAGTSGRFRHRV